MIYLFNSRGFDFILFESKINVKYNASYQVTFPTEFTSRIDMILHLKNDNYPILFPIVCILQSKKGKKSDNSKGA